MAYASVGFDLPSQADTKAFLATHLWLVVACLVWAPIVLLIFACLEDGAVGTSRQIKRSIHLQALLVALDNVVGLKSNRFASAIKELQIKKLTADEVFLRITEPDKQIGQLLQAVYHFVALLVGEPGSTSVKVVLVRIQDGLPVEYLHSLPNNRQPSTQLLDELNGKRSLFAEAARYRKPQYVEDLEIHRIEHNHRYCFLDSEEAGSIVAFPIQGLDQVEMVLSIKSEKIKLFGKKFLTENSMFIDSFVSRLELENKLLYLRKEVLNSSCLPKQ